MVRALNQRNDATAGSDDSIPFHILPQMQQMDAADHVNACATICGRMTAETLRVADRQQLASLHSALVRPFPDSLIFLMSRFTSGPQSVVSKLLQKVVHEYMYSQTIVQIMSACSAVKADADTRQRLVTSLVTLPDALTAVFQTKVPDSFTPQKYNQRLTQVLLLVIQAVAETMNQEVDCDLTLVSDLISRLCVRGCSDLLYTHFIRAVVTLMQKEPVYQRLMYHVLVHKQPDRSLEPILTVILCRCKSGKEVCSLIQEAVTRRPKVRYLLTDKFVQVTCFSEPRFARNLMQYLSSSDESAFLSALRTCVDCWSSPSSLKYRSPNHTLFICSLLVSAVPFLKKLRAKDRQQLHTRLMTGMETHVNSSLIELRNSGLFVGQLLMNELATDMPEVDMKLEEDDNVRHLKQFLNPAFDEIPAESPAPAAKREKLIQVVGDEDQDNEEESDEQMDDPLSPMKKPVYLLDCLQGLQSEDEEWKLVCLSCTEHLIRSSRSTACDLSDELTQTLVHMQSDSPDRISALVAVTTTAPKSVSQILIHAFYDRNLALCVRLDILSVLSKASIELSSGFRAKADHLLSPATDLMEEAVVPAEVRLMETSWQQVVEDRIKQKTRRFASASRPIEGKVNAFTAFAADFFFPLINRFDGKDVIFLLKDSMPVLVSRLLYTLSIILNSASHQLVSRRMGSALLEFGLEFRQDADPLVRRAVVFSFASILSAVPASTLVNDLRHQLTRMKDWLLLVKEQDVDHDVRQSSLRTLFLLRDVVSSED